MCLQDWYTVLEHYHRLNATISDLIMGNTYKFRVFAENKCGMSEDAAITKGEAKIVKTGTSSPFVPKLSSRRSLSGTFMSYPSADLCSDQLPLVH